MTHEFISILKQALDWQNKKIKSVLATVVHLDGSSYRKPGVSMLINENGDIFGAVSGGCVEKAVVQESRVVFKSGKAHLMTYDGRLRLGCEGILKILIEPFDVNTDLLSKVLKSNADRISFQWHSLFCLEKEDNNKNAHSYITFNSGEKVYFREDISNDIDSDNFHKEYTPMHQLILFGTGFDASIMCKMAQNLGFQVGVIHTERETPDSNDFPGFTELIPKNKTSIKSLKIDGKTAVVLMSHSYNQDLESLKLLAQTKPGFIGVLGPVKRRNQLINALDESGVDYDFDFLDLIHGPAGLDIGSITASEINLSILAQILAIFNNRDAKALSNLNGSIHD